MDTSTGTLDAMAAPVDIEWTTALADAPANPVVSDTAIATSSGTGEQASASGVSQTGKVLALSLPSNFPSGESVSTANAKPVPYVERVEQIAGDAASANTPLSNQWGSNQPRITVHNDGTIRVLYLRSDSSGQIAWQVMKRDPRTGAWTAEAKGLSTDDVMMVRDPQSDLAHVVAWPNSAPAIYSSPSFAGKAVPGVWQKIIPANRHYGATGIGPDGTLCIKASVELATTLVSTTNTSSQYVCGRYDAQASRWTWNNPVTQFIDLRRAYDYIFPGGAGDAASFVATAQVDLYKDAAGLKMLSVASGNYTFNGVSIYSSGVASASNWRLSEMVQPIRVASTSADAPVARQIDAFVDGKQRVMSLYLVSDPGNSGARGHYLAVTDKNGNAIYNGKLGTLPYGYVRVFQDIKARLWLLWTTQGPQRTDVKLYPLNESTSSGRTTFTLGSGTDLSLPMTPYSILGSAFLAVPRGGQTPGNALDGFFVACDGTYVDKALIACDLRGTDHQRVVHFRIRLPD